MGLSSSQSHVFLDHLTPSHPSSACQDLSLSSRLIHSTVYPIVPGGHLTGNFNFVYIKGISDLSPRTWALLEIFLISINGNVGLSRHEPQNQLGP